MICWWRSGRLSQSDICCALLSGCPRQSLTRSLKPFSSVFTSPAMMLSSAVSSASGHKLSICHSTATQLTNTAVSQQSSTSSFKHNRSYINQKMQELLIRWHINYCAQLSLTDKLVKYFNYNYVKIICVKKQSKWRTPLVYEMKTLHNCKFQPLQWTDTIHINIHESNT